MGITNGELKQKRAEFFARMRKKYNTTNEEIVHVLVRRGYSGFKLSEQKQYEHAIKSHFDTLKNNGEEKGGGGNSFRNERVYYPCPIAGCTGKKIEIMEYGRKYWKCTVGGSSHYLAYRTAEIRMHKAPYDMNIEEMAAHFLNIIEDKVEE